MRTLPQAEAAQFNFELYLSFCTVFLHNLISSLLYTFWLVFNGRLLLADAEVKTLLGSSVKIFSLLSKAQFLFRGMVITVYLNNDVTYLWWFGRLCVWIRLQEAQKMMEKLLTIYLFLAEREALKIENKSQGRLVNFLKFAYILKSHTDPSAKSGEVLLA